MKQKLTPAQWAILIILGLLMGLLLLYFNDVITGYDRQLEQIKQPE